MDVLLLSVVGIEPRSSYCALSLSYNTAHHTIYFKAKGNKFKRFAEFIFLPQDQQGFCFPNNLSIVSGVS